jgi:hypothetical protein
VEVDVAEFSNRGNVKRTRVVVDLRVRSQRGAQQVGLGALGHGLGWPAIMQ